MTRDRRGFENTFLLHADRPGDRPRLLYWYRTAPGITLGRSPLDEDAIRTIEDSHPDIDFDWPAILALSEVMMPEEEAPVRPQKRPKKQGPPREQQQREQRPRDNGRDDFPAEARPEESFEVAESPEPAEPGFPAAEPTAQVDEVDNAPPLNRLLDELVGREIATRLRARYAEIAGRIDEVGADQREALSRRAEALNPDRWLTPDAILDGVRAADSLYDGLRNDLGA